jgi:hypothetical protein
MFLKTAAIYEQYEELKNLTRLDWYEELMMRDIMEFVEIFGETDPNLVLVTSDYLADYYMYEVAEQYGIDFDTMMERMESVECGGRTYRYLPN